MTKKFGYTLIEILVALSIVSTIFVIGYLSFREFARRQALLAAGRQIHSALRLAQEQALAGNKPSGCSILVGYAFTAINASTYEVTGVCSNASFLVKTQDLPEGIVFEPLPSPNPVVFKILGQGTNIVSGSRTNFVLLQEATNNQSTVSVNWTGEIK
jgi:prepilin-type N-terminal cleavage/methylation domain-containing protein